MRVRDAKPPGEASVESPTRGHLLLKLDKQQLLDLLRARISDLLESLMASQATVQSGAFHEENRQEHPKDTRAIEAAYLARGLAERVETARDMVAALRALKLRDFGNDDPIALGAVVGLESADGTRSLYFLVPRAGGETLAHDGETVHTISPEAPIGRALLGALVGDDIVLELPRGVSRLHVAWVA
jgi:transcription elongation GreA/GreB family factor